MKIDWLKQFQICIRSLRFPRRRRHDRRSLGNFAEVHERRILLTVTAVWTGSTSELSITSDAAETVTVTVNAGKVHVDDGDTVTITNGVPAPADVESITVNDIHGTAPQEFDLSQVTSADFTSLTSVSITAAGGNDTVKGSELGDSILGGDGNDSVTGGAGNDTVTGSAGADILVGGSGADSVSGGNDDDFLIGDDVYMADGSHNAADAGADDLDGQSGDDTVAGSSSEDTLTGETQVDTFNLFDTFSSENFDWIDTV